MVLMFSIINDLFKNVTEPLAQVKPCLTKVLTGKTAPARMDCPWRYNTGFDISR
jgi:hypothetical protein